MDGRSSSLPSILFFYEPKLFLFLADDLPLNVSRETLQSSRFLRQIKQVIIRRLIQLLQRISKEDPAKYDEIVKVLGSTLKLGMIESRQESEKIGPLLRFSTNQNNATSLEAYIQNRKKAQTQIFYLAAAGQPVESLKRNLFVEKLSARVCSRCVNIGKHFRCYFFRVMRLFLQLIHWTKSCSQPSTDGSKCLP